jgi:hypothetical protein
MTAAAAAVAALALVVALVVAVQVMGLRRRLDGVPKDADVVGLLRSLDRDLNDVEAVVADLAPRLERVEHELPNAISRTGVVVYDAFGDIAGNLSRSIALLDGTGDGVVISLLIGRSETRFYTKQVRALRGLEELSPEEAEAVAQAMRR